ncbi:MAG: S9 family peptidase [Nocardioidaceae bacterium]
MTPTPPQKAAAPPVARRDPVVRDLHGVRRVDDYAWLRDTGSPRVRAHLDAERAFYDASTAHLTSLVETMAEEMASRTPATDSSVSWRLDAFSYYTRTPSGSEYAQLLRDLLPHDDHTATESVAETPSGHESGNDPADSELLLDPATLAGGSSYVDLGVSLVSPDERLLAYSVDTTGDEVFTLRFRDLSTGDDLEDSVARTYYGGGWSVGAGHFFYTVHDEAYRPYQVWRHAIGTSPDDDVLVFVEADERFEVCVRATRSGDLIVIWSESRDTSEVWVVDAHDASGPARCVQPRRAGVQYHCEHARTSAGDTLLIVTNLDAAEFRLMAAPLADPGADRWAEIVAENPDERLERVDAFGDHLVLSLRTGGMPRLRVLPLDPDGAIVEVECTLPAGTIALSTNTWYRAHSVRVVEQSYTEPPTWWDVDLGTGERRLVRREPVPGYDPEGYVSERVSVEAPDGEDVPVTVVRRHDVPVDGSAPALFYGYGAYEYSFEPDFDRCLPSLLDRGVVFVHAHVRGGGERGRRWWLDGSLAAKQNTFSDHIAVADMFARGLVHPDRIATRGLSAGGLLQAAVFSQRPDRWRAVVAEVPFVDVVTTMLDPSIPLTANEWDEWGDPRQSDAFAWMLAYSPYDNLPEPGSRPPLLVTGAVNDPRVMVWEPAKWVAALRETDPAWSPRCLFRCEVGEGAHSGPSGRFAHQRYEAEVYAWVLSHIG